MHHAGDREPADAVEQAARDELAAYTLVHGDPRFIHQHAVDAYAAQRATEDSPWIGVAFALIGLYLHVERGVSGREVQRAHMRLARRRRAWPRFELPKDRGAMTILDVVAAPPGEERDRAIDRWCAVVWASWAERRDEVIDLLRAAGEDVPEPNG